MITKFRTRLIVLLCLCLFTCVIFYLWLNYINMSTCGEYPGKCENKGRFVYVRDKGLTDYRKSKKAKIDSLFTSEEMKKLQENECKIPILDPYEPSMLNYFHSFKIDCERHTFFKPYFKEDYGPDASPEIVMKEPLPANLSCCYTNIRFSDFDKYKLNKLDECHQISEIRTRIPSDYQFVVVLCWTGKQLKHSSPKLPQMYANLTFHNKELLIFVPKAPAQLIKEKKPLLQKTKAYLSHPPLNVIILGFDQVSRLNFIRQMHRSFEYLRSELKAIDLKGFNKIGDATLNNTLAILTGYDFGSIQKNKQWWNPKQPFFDKLPWIWKNFSDLGYITSSGDDYVSVFNYRFDGFLKKPTDYYLHPLIQWLRTKFKDGWRSNEFISSKLCLGNEVIFNLLQNYAKKTAKSLNDHPYFEYLWNSRVHEKPHYPSLVDDGLLSTLQYFQESGVLNKSLVILLSDHGWRVGRIMSQAQARLENKMSFSFLLLPKWFKEVYPEAHENLLGNQYRLTTPYDIHSTLEDILHPERNLKTQSISERSSNLGRSSKGISLFLPIPKNRTCTTAGIDEVWCACSTYESILDTNTILDSISLAKFAVDTINSWLKPFNSCMQYELDKVFSAEVKLHPEPGMGNTFRIIFSVLAAQYPPTFEVVVSTSKGWFPTSNYSFEEAKRFMNMSTEVFRLTKYSTSPCIEVYSMKKICTCKKYKLFRKIKVKKIRKTS